MNERTIWDKLISAGMTKAGASGLMGNLYAESALNPKNLQQTYEKSLGYSDDSYTQAVNSGKYSNFIHDSAGYGLAQWTFWTRKQSLLTFAKERNCSIGNLDMQLDFLIKELKSGYAGVWKTLCTASDVRTASNAVLFQYESPANQGTSVQEFRYQQSMRFYNMFANTETSGTAKSISEIAQEVLADKWGTGEDRKARLTAAGYDYQAVQKAVNELLTTNENHAVTVENPVATVKWELVSVEINVRIDGKLYSKTVNFEQE